MRTLTPGETASAVDRPGRYQILACCEAIARGGGQPPDGMPELAPEMAYQATEPNVFVFYGVVRDQGALLSLLKALVNRELIIQSVRRLDNDDLLDPLYATDNQDNLLSQPGT